MTPQKLCQSKEREPRSALEKSSTLSLSTTSASWPTSPSQRETATSRLLCTRVLRDGSTLVQGFQDDPHNWQNLPEMLPANMQRNRNSSGKAIQKSRSQNYLLNLLKNMIFQIMEFAQLELNMLGLYFLIGWHTQEQEGAQPWTRKWERTAHFWNDIFVTWQVKRDDRIFVIWQYLWVLFRNHCFRQLSDWLTFFRTKKNRQLGGYTIFVNWQTKEKFVNWQDNFRQKAALPRREGFLATAKRGKRRRKRRRAGASASASASKAAEGAAVTKGIGRNTTLKT